MTSPSHTVTNWERWRPPPGGEPALAGGVSPVTGSYTGHGGTAHRGGATRTSPERKALCHWTDEGHPHHSASAGTRDEPKTNTEHSRRY